jgi:hypothetical protein
MHGYAVLLTQGPSHYSLWDSQEKRQSILVGLAKVCAALAPNI